MVISVRLRIFAAKQVATSINEKDAGSCTYDHVAAVSTTCMAASACTGETEVPAPDDAGFYTDPNYVLCTTDTDCTRVDAGAYCVPVAASSLKVVVGVCEATP